MASPYLANMAMGFVKAKNAQAKEALDRAYAEEQDKKKRDLDFEQQKRLSALAFENLMQKEVVDRSFNQQANARIAEQYAKIYQTATDPTTKKQAKKWMDVYAGAGDLPSTTVESLGKNLSAEKAEQKTAQDYERERKERNETVFDEKLGELAELDMDQLGADPKLRQRTFLQMARGLDSDYVDQLKEQFDAYFPKPFFEKMPQAYQNMEIRYRTLINQHGKARGLLEEGKTTEQAVSEMESEITSLADSLNEWAKANGYPETYVKFEEETVEKPGLIQQLTGGKFGSPNVQTVTKQVTPGKPGLAEQKPVVPTPSILIDYQTRKLQLVKEFPEKTAQEIAKILKEEKGQTWQ